MAFRLIPQSLLAPVSSRVFVLAGFVIIVPFSHLLSSIHFLCPPYFYTGLAPTTLIFLTMVLLNLPISIIALTYLSTIVSAVPIALPRRGFSLRQLTKPDTQSRTINLPGIYASSFTKFGKAVPQGIKDAADNGSAVAKPEANDKEYLTPVKVGDTTLNLDIDTGSADL